MPAYNITALKAVTTVSGLATYANDSTNKILFGLMLLAIFFVMLFVLKKWEFDKALLSSSFACLILSIILAYAQLLNFMFILIFLIIMAFSGFFMYMSR